VEKVINEEAAARTSAPAKALRTRWLTFYIYIFLPFMIWASFGSIFRQCLDLKLAGLQVTMAFFDFVPAVVASLFIAILIYGLHKRRLWAWTCNWIFLAYKTLINPIGTSQEVIVYVLTVILTAGCFFLPNYQYFKKRRGLFT
jgi:hypothetical protein